jgi:uncharacterized protein YciI
MLTGEKANQADRTIKMRIPELCFAVVYAPGPNWKEREQQRQDDLKAHISYQHSWLDKGILLMGGPYPDDEGGLALFAADSEDEIQALVAADPCVASGTYQVTVHQWRIAVNSLEG